MAEQFDWDKDAEDFDWDAEEDAPESDGAFAGADAAATAQRSMPDTAGGYAAGALGDMGAMLARGKPYSEEEARGAVAAAIQGPGLNWADEAAGLQAAQRAAMSAFPSIGKDGGIVPATRRGDRVDLGWAYRQGRDAFRGLEAGFREQHPAAALALTVGAGAALGSPFAGGQGLGRYAPAATEGFVAGMGAEDEEDAGSMLRSGAAGAPLSVAGQLVGEGVGGLVNLGRRAVTGLVQPSAAAQSLEAKGVKDLTIGQMAPDSFPAQMEEVGTSTAAMGPSIKGQRLAGKQDWQVAVLNEVRPPGMAPVQPGLPIADQMQALSDGFDAVYSQARGVPIIPQGIDAIVDAADNQGVIADRNARDKIRDFLANQITKLRPLGNGKVLSDDLISVRSDIRAAMRKTKDEESRELLRLAADDVTNLLDAQLPPPASNALRAADAAYAKFKALDDAVWRSGDQVEGFSPAQLSEAVRASNSGNHSAYNRGAGRASGVRDLSAAGRDTLEARTAVTGARALANFPGVGSLAYTMNLPGPKAALLGRTATQQRMSQAPWFQQLAGVGQPAGRVGAAYGREEARQSIAKAPEGDLLAYLAENNPESLGPYAATLQRAAADGNLPLVHWRLQQTDPNYRATLEEARKAQAQ